MINGNPYFKHMIKCITKSIILFAGLQINSLAIDQQPIEPDRIIDVIKTEKCTGTLFARVVHDNKLKWIHASIETGDLTNVMRVLNKPSKEAVHKNGPFGSTFIMKISVFKPTAVRILDVRLWNGTVCYDWLSSPARSFKFNDSMAYEELSAHLIKMSQTKTNYIAADSLEELLDKLSLGDPQVLSLKQSLE
jgi:hypothetical protein